MNKVRTINIDGAEIQTSLTPLEIASLPEKNKELQERINKVTKCIENSKEYKAAKAMELNEKQSVLIKALSILKEENNGS